MSKLKLFFIESPDPLDLLEERSEVLSLFQICKLFEYEVAHKNVISKRALKEFLDFISNIFSSTNNHNHDSSTLCIHLSCHGNDTGIGIGYDFIKWEELYQMFESISKEAFKYLNDYLLIISSCNADKQGLSYLFQKNLKNNTNSQPPKYIFMTTEEVGWKESLISWANFYFQLNSINLDKNKEFQSLLNSIKKMTSISLKYARWDERKRQYRNYTGSGGKLI
ncbi:MAG: hypothetical protein HYV28_05385 [Ignavibacteriales bacterium]|nr:hypothetical protein [Ignavibacteriales bacterium]